MPFEGVRDECDSWMRAGLDRFVKTSLVAPLEVRGTGHGVESSWAAIVSSILASPPNRIN